MSVIPIDSVTGAVKGTIQSAIALASARTGVNFNYLLGQAQVESGLRADAKAGTSSASGLYQFIEQSWLAVVKKHGAEHGLGWAADNISQGANGRLTVSDPGTRRAILALRNDPNAASLMAAEHAADNKTAIESSLGRTATGTDLYMAHFLGLGGARSFLKNLQANPDQAGAALFPAAARANHNIFYGDGGQPRSLSEIYDRFSAKLDRGAAAVGAVGLASGNVTPADNGGAEIIPGNGESQSSATRWAQATIDQLQGGTGRMQSLLRPTPDTARLAYLMLARLGG
ncbi:lytic transglycosylase domain-containing protein [Sphingomonas sp. 28-63-12]|uniref:lytic transglycosylase domain-containing protein n=1 Tax=Sphingomonas sp. 28-63-12 TaxID=1970434 RepID=UPI000BDA4DD4|nr:MAG: flagellar biosynthesis protein FlgJ [Sphingomonas sp. 28-63-12]